MTLEMSTRVRYGGNHTYPNQVQVYTINLKLASIQTEGSQTAMEPHDIWNSVSLLYTHTIPGVHFQAMQIGFKLG